MSKVSISLERVDWIEAALTRLRSGGIDNVRIEALARDLKVTKGSFYWHFKTREELLDALIEHWEKSATGNAIRAVEEAGGTPVERLRHMSKITIQNFGNFLPLELALRDWGRREPKVWQAIKRIDKQRIDFTRELFEEIHGDTEQAEVSAWMFYSLFLGDNLIAAENEKLGHEEMLWRAIDTLTNTDQVSPIITDSEDV